MESIDADVCEQEHCLELLLLLSRACYVILVGREESTVRSTVLVLHRGTWFGSEDTHKQERVSYWYIPWCE